MSFRLLNELLQRATRHVLGDENHARRFALFVQPILVKLDNVWVLELYEPIEDIVDCLLFGLEIFALGEAYFIPDDLYPVLRVHRQVGGIDTRDVVLLNLIGHRENSKT